MKKISSIIVLTILSLVIVGCTNSGVIGEEQKNQLANQSVLIKSQPAPQLTYSVERQNLIDRMKRMNDRNLVGYIYLLSDTGQVVTSYVTKGKVTNMGAYLTSYDAIVNSQGGSCSGSGCYTVEAPDYDGAYGPDQEGIFFFTDTGAMVEWSGKYIWTDQPLSVKTPVSLVRQVK